MRSRNIKRFTRPQQPAYFTGSELTQILNYGANKIKQFKNQTSPTRYNVDITCTVEN